MASQRKTIRSQLVTTLAAVSDFTGRVQEGKYDAVEPADLKEGPQLLVFSTAEETSPITKNPRRLGRVLELVVEIYERAEKKADGTFESIEQLLDDHCEAVENAIEADSTLNGTVKDTYVSTTAYDITPDSAWVEGAAILTLATYYETVEGV